MTIIRAGQTVETGTLAELRHLTRITIEAETPAGPVHEQVEPAELPAALERLARAGVTNLVAHPPTLEELFLRHYGPPAGAPHAPDRRRAPARP